MKRSDLLAHLSAHGCRQERERARHSIWINPATGNIQAVPRHREIKKFTTRNQPGFGSYGVAQTFANPAFTGFAIPSIHDDQALLCPMSRRSSVRATPAGPG